MKGARRFWVAAGMLVVWAAAGDGLLRSVHPGVQGKAEAAIEGRRDQETQTSTINLDQAVKVEVPRGADLKPASFQTPDGKQGWAVRIPGGRPIATPAYADGLIFFGGGYGSHEFYALDATTGQVAWKIRTKDDGPTAAVVEDGYVVFNTESCTLVVVDAKTGKVIWEKWLGDPLMSQPAIWKGRLYIVYPAGHPRSQVKPSEARSRGGHRLLCLDLRTGDFIWEQEVTGDAISAPVIADGVVYVTCFDGTTFAFQATDGKLLWTKENSGTSAPVISSGQLVQTRKQIRDGQRYEGLMRADAKQGQDKDDAPLAQTKAEYLAPDKGGAVGLTAEKSQSLDSSVGFSTPPPAARLSAANKNVGVNSVVRGWAFQGSRAAVRDGRILNVQGRYINALGETDGRARWRAEVKAAKLADDQQVLAPPALGAAYLYLAGSDGFLLTVRQSDGAVGFLYRLGHPVAFQPALARGNVYVGTVDGMVICLKTGEADADGWYAWGGNAQHNK